MNNRGITLVELMTVTAIISILLAAFGFSYQDWMGKYRVERVTKELYVDLMRARVTAMERNLEHYAVFTENTYSLIEDSNDSGEKENSDAVLQTFPKMVDYVVAWNGGGKITFDKKGLMSNLGTVLIKSTVRPDFDCIKVSRTRIIMGRYEGDQNEAFDGDKCTAK